MSHSSGNRVAALVALILATILVTAPAPVPGRQAQPTPLQLFQKLLPVIRHPRCSNCHGGLDPRSPAHPGMAEVLDSSACEPCHKDVRTWEQPIPAHFFPGKTDKELCSLFSDFASKQGHQMFISNHIAGDELIGAAFIGMIGGARDDSLPAIPPPIKHAVFKQLAQAWLSGGQGACVADGTITQEESVHWADIWHTAPDTDWRMQQNQTRTVTITLNPAGQFLADIRVDGVDSLIQVQHSTSRQGRPCTVTSTTITRYAGATTGPASVRVRDTMLFGDTKPPQKDYRIDVTLPKETTTHTETNTAEDMCGFGMGAGDGGVQSFTWDKWTFTIEGHLDDPRYKHLWGACDKTMKSSDVGNPELLSALKGVCFKFIDVGSKEPWLMNHTGSASNHDGSDVPFRVVTQWNIAYHP